MLTTVKSKYIFAVLIVVLFFGFSVCNGFAEIEKSYDKFEEYTNHRSYFENVGPWDLLILRFIKKDGKITQKNIFLALIKNDWHFFSEEELLMKIDGELNKIRCLGTKTDQGDYSLTTVGLYSLDDSTITKISNANDVSIRVYMKNVQNITWDIPDKVLNEWQELIERSDVLK